jgi:hypothetical protein
MIGAFLLLMAVVIGCWLALMAAGATSGFLINLIARTLFVAAIAKIAVGLVIAVAFFVYIYVIIRSSFLLAPVVIAEEKANLKRAWALGRGNFWRIFLVLLAIMVPAIAIELVFMFKFIMQGMPIAPAHATPEQIAATQAGIAAWNAANMARMTRNWYISYPLLGAFSVVFYGLTCGAQAFAYRALTDGETTTNPR